MRQTDPKRLTALMRGELDWVVMKCLEKDRDRRYETANGLAGDVQRYLADEPVEARPPSRGLPAAEVRPAEPGAGAGGRAGPVGAGRRNGRDVGRAVPGRAAAGRGGGRAAAEAERADGEQRAKGEALAAAELAKKRLDQIRVGRELLKAFADINFPALGEETEATELLRYQLLAAAGNGMRRLIVEVESGDTARAAGALGLMAEMYSILGKAADAAKLRVERAKSLREQAPPPRPVNP